MLSHPVPAFLLAVRVRVERQRVCAMLDEEVLRCLKTRGSLRISTDSSESLNVISVDTIEINFDASLDYHLLKTISTGFHL